LKLREARTIGGFRFEKPNSAVNPLQLKPFSVPFLAGAVGSGAPLGRKAL